MNQHLRHFILPKLNRAFFIRLACVVVCSFLFFKFILVPARIQGGSMEPTYHDGRLIFYMPMLRFVKQPEINDVVMIRLAGNRIMLLKRIVALPNDTVQWRNGILFRNNAAIDEPYVKFNDDWSTESVKVPPDHVYVVGDNRGMPQEQHDFGYTPQSRIGGYALW